MHVYIYIYYIYTPGHLGTQKLFFPHRLGLTRLLFRLKARSDEPKYGLLTRVKSKETFGFILAFFLDMFCFFLANCQAECVFGPTLAQSQSNGHVFSITCYLCSIKHILTVDDLFSHYGKKHAKLEI